MVAITVILAAVIAAFVLDMGDDLGDDGAPDTVWSSSDSASEIISESNDWSEDEDAHEPTDAYSEPGIEIAAFEHDGGDPVTAEDLEVSISQENANISDDSLDWSIAATEMTAGDEVVVTVGAEFDDSDYYSEGEVILIEEGTELTLTWNDGGSSSTMNDHTFTSDIVFVEGE